MSLAGAEPWLIAFVVMAFLIAGGIKGTTGIGLPTAAVGLMSQVMEPREAIALVVFPSLLSNAWQIWRTGRFAATLRRYGLYIACLMGMITLVSLTITARVATDTLMLILGCVIILFSVSSLAWAPPFIPARWDRTGQVASGLASGVLGGMTGIWAPPMVTYLLGRRVEKDEFVRASGVMIFMGTLPLIWGFWQIGIVTGGLAVLSIALTAPALVGFALGEAIRKRLGAERFRRVVLIVFLLMGLHLLRRAVLS